LCGVQIVSALWQLKGALCHAGAEFAGVVDRQNF